MHRGCGHVSTDDGRYGEAGKVKVCRDEEVRYTELKHRAHHGEWMRGMACTKHDEVIAN